MVIFVNGCKITAGTSPTAVALTAITNKSNEYETVRFVFSGFGIGGDSLCTRPECPVFLA